MDAQVIENSKAPTAAQRTRKMKATEADLAFGRRALDAAARRVGYQTWSALLAECTGARGALLLVDFVVDCPFGVHEEYAASLRRAGLQMRAVRFVDLVVGRADVLTLTEGDAEAIQARAIPVVDLGLLDPVDNTQNNA
ncbi:hypothetical protein [Paraburkholderia sp. SIMBA_054]|uniref:hypothetical protein n=1 Tax=Paraburkholderia sp. SIMBA_054 TaxID=3085795 RepID=UPI00397B5222